MSAVGFLGLGAMGGPIAARLLAAGHDVHGTNRTRSKAQPLIERGLIWHATPREAAAAADVVFSMVSDDAALEAIATGPDGILAGLGPGKVYVDMSTVSPTASGERRARRAGEGARRPDARRSGVGQRPPGRGRHAHDHGRRRGERAAAGRAPARRARAVGHPR